MEQQSQNNISNSHIKSENNQINTDNSPLNILLIIRDLILSKNKETFLNNIINIDKSSQNSLETISSQDFIYYIISLALYLSDKIEGGEKIAILKENSYYYLIIEFAIILSGGISVPISKDISKDYLKYQLQECNINHIFLDNILIEDIMTISNEENKKYNIIDQDKLHKLLQEFKNHNYEKDFLIKSFNEFYKSFIEKEKKDEDIILYIIYSSGSIGKPNAVMITNKNMVHQIAATNIFFQNITSNSNILSFLPLSHIFEKMVMLFYLSKIDLNIFFVANKNYIKDAIKIYKINYLTTVPRFIEKINEAIINQLSENKFKKILLLPIYNLCKRKIINKESIIYKLFLSKIRNKISNDLKMIISGSSNLDISYQILFYNMNILLFSGYGMTELSPVISTNYVKNFRFGSVGKLYPYIRAVISEDNELLVKGPNLCKGYYKNEEKFSNSINQDGYFKTGDLAYFDEEDYLYIYGRKKELFKTSLGKYINPSNLETKLNLFLVKYSIFVDYLVIFADNRKFTSLLLFIEDKNNFQNIDIENLSNIISKFNKNLNKWERIIKFKLLNEVLTIKDNSLTSSFKINRKNIEKKYIDIIDEFYQ